MSTLKNFRVTILTFSITYLHLRKDLKTGIISKENFNSLIIYITNLYKFHTQILKSGSKYEEKTETCLIYLDHHLIKNNLLLSLEQLTSKELHSISTSPKYFSSLLPNWNLDRKLIYLLPRKIRRSTSFMDLQHKILSNVLYLNKMLFRFGKSSSPLCTFCKLHDDTLIHLFSSYNQVILLCMK